MKAEDIYQLKEQAVRELTEATDEKSLEELRIRYLGRKGRLQEVMQELKLADPGERPRIGQAANAFKQEVAAEFDKRRAVLKEQASAHKRSAFFDVTLPGRWPAFGTHHPITRITDRIAEIFQTLGFTVAEGPDIETVYHNFDALNTPEDHPSRDIQDTFYLEDGTLLRCHTSPVQVRYMENHPPPVRIIAPGRCYRRDTPDATHSANFHQVEGLYVDEQVSLADLKGDLSYFARQLMGPEVQIRFRPHFFPFTEPSVEVDFTCHNCRGSGCRICKGSGWIEIMGAGMVDPNVFESVGYKSVTGYAFGMGIERIAMILYGITDIRMLYDNDVRFLSQF